MTSTTAIDLQSGLYLTMIQQLGLDKDKFQMIMTGQPLGQTSDSLWGYCDSIPPLSATNTYDAGRGNGFFQNYRAIVNTILPQGGGQWRDTMGDAMGAWLKYKKSLTAAQVKDAGGMELVFAEWADNNLDPDIKSKAKTQYKQLSNSVVSLAVDAVNDPANLTVTGGPTYSETIQNLKDRIPHGVAAAVHYDSETASTDTSHTWAKGKVGGRYDIFSASASGSYDQLNKKSMSSHVTVDINFSHFLQGFSASPGAWYSKPALALALATQDNTVWPAGQHPAWDELFGADGTVLRMASSLVVVDGITMKFTSKATYSQSDATKINADASVGVWPFFSLTTSGGYHHQATLNESSELEVTVTAPMGNPQILGVYVEPLATWLGGK
jgi:hypothetical protein